MTKTPIMTAYRQQALACAALLSAGPRRTSELKATIPDAPRTLLRNVYGWFARVERGIYALTQEGMTALSRWPQADRRDEPACDRVVPILHDGRQSESKRLRDDPTINAAKRRASHRAGDHPAGSR